MAEVTPLPAASVLLLRDDPLEVLMIRRHENASFVPSAWVFPGGVAEAADYAAADGTDVGAMRVCAARELFEETGIRIDAGQLVWTSHWITPAGVPKRFDTYFFLAKIGRGIDATLNEESVDAAWIEPAKAIESLQIVFPTRKNLEAMAGFATVDALIASRRGAEIPTIEPIMVMTNGKPKFVLP